MKKYDQKGHIYNELEECACGNELKLDEFIEERDFVSPAMSTAGHSMATSLIDAEVGRSMNGLGGNNPVDLSSIENGDLIKRYLIGELSSQDAIYISMNRVRVREVQDGIKS